MAGAFKITDAGSADRTISTIQAFDAGGVDRTVTEGRIIGPDGVDRVFFGSLSSGITVDRTSTFGAVGSSSTQVVATRSVTVSVDGGVAPFTYLWSHVSGDIIGIGDSTSATTAFSEAVAPASSKTAVFKCTVTDAAGVSAESPEVTATIHNFGGTL